MVGKRKDLPSKSELNQLYVIDKKSMREIGELFVGGASKIRCMLIEYKIPVITTISGASAALRAIRVKKNQFNYISLQEIFKS